MSVYKITGSILTLLGIGLFSSKAGGIYSLIGILSFLVGIALLIKEKKT